MLKGNIIELMEYTQKLIDRLECMAPLDSEDKELVKESEQALSDARIGLEENGTVIV